jgi:hypothetical protein
MPRHFAPITIEELSGKILNAWELHDDSGNYQAEPMLDDIRYSWPDLTPQIRKDFKVDVDFENVGCEKDYEYLGYDEDTKESKYATQPKDTVSNQLIGFNTRPSGLTFLGIYAGGDWEQAVYFIIYWDGKKLRCYIPTKGNFWNTTTKTAYGNDEDADSKNIGKRFPKMLESADSDYGISTEDLWQNDSHYQQMLEDIDQRIKPK